MENIHKVRGRIQTIEVPLVYWNTKEIYGIYIKITAFHQRAGAQGITPAKAGIHVFQCLQWTPAFAVVTVIRAIIDFVIGSKQLTEICRQIYEKIGVDISIYS